MEPISALVDALVVGAAAMLENTASAAVKTAYAKLRQLLVQQLGPESADAVEMLEAKPDSKPRRGVVEEELQQVGAQTHAEVIAQAQAVVEAVERDTPELPKALGLDLEGIKATFLKVGDVRSEGTGVRLRDSEFSGGITIGDVTAGKPDPS